MTERIRRARRRSRLQRGRVVFAAPPVPAWVPDPEPAEGARALRLARVVARAGGGPGRLQPAWVVARAARGPGRLQPVWVVARAARGPGRLQPLEEAVLRTVSDASAVSSVVGR